MNNNIKIFIMDVDGTLTDGKIYIGPEGEVLKAFNVKDGLGIKKLRAFGIEPVLISGRKSNLVLARAEELNINHVYLGVSDKVKAYEKLKKKINFIDDEVAFIGDDENDCELMKKVKFKFTVANATNKLKKICNYESIHDGGEGAVRDVIELILSKDLGRYIK